MRGHYCWPHYAQGLFFNRTIAITPKTRATNDRTPFTLTFHPVSNFIKVNRNFYLLESDSSTLNILSQSPFFSLRKTVILDVLFLLIHERETRNEGVLELYGILLAVMCYVLAAPSSQFSGIDQKSKICDFTMYPPFSLRYSHKNHSISSNYDIFWLTFIMNE